MSFAELLDEALGRPPGVATAQPQARWAAHPQPPVAGPFLFSRPLTAPSPRWPSGPPSPRRADHHFDDGQRRAFNRLLDLGAALDANFTADDLKREYRRLAQRFHPDRHSQASPLERERLARVFTDTVNGYQQLRPLVEPRH